MVVPAACVPTRGVHQYHSGARSTRCKTASLFVSCFSARASVPVLTLVPLCRVVQIDAALYERAIAATAAK
jgi:hypothetical protein